MIMSYRMVWILRVPRLKHEFHHIMSLMAFVGLKLAETQAATEDLSCLPTLRIADIDNQVKTTPLIHTKLGRVALADALFAA